MYLLYSPCIQPLGPQRLTRHLLYSPSIQYLGPQRLTRHLLYSPSIQHLGPQRLTRHLLYSPSIQHLGQQRLTRHLLYSPSIQHLGPQRLTRHLLYLPSIQHLGPQRLTRYLLYSPSIQYLGPQRLTKYLLYSPGTWDCSECRTLKSLSLKLYQSRHNLSAIQVNKDTTHLVLNAHRDTSVAINRAIPQTLNATQGHKHWLLIQPLIDIYPITRYHLTQPEHFTRDTIILHCNQSGVLIHNITQVYNIITIRS